MRLLMNLLRFQAVSSCRTSVGTQFSLVEYAEKIFAVSAALEESSFAISSLINIMTLDFRSSLPKMSLLTCLATLKRFIRDETVGSSDE